MIDGLIKHLEDLQVEQEETEECGDLEDRLEIATVVGEHRALLKAAKNGAKIKWWPCSICNEAGRVGVYDDQWECTACKGRLGHYAKEWR